MCDVPWYFLFCSVLFLKTLVTAVNKDFTTINLKHIGLDFWNLKNWTTTEQDYGQV